MGPEPDKMTSREEDDHGYLSIVAYLEDCLALHGDSHRGVDWPKKEDTCTRYQVMLDVVHRPEDGTVTLLDFGCGASHLLDYMVQQGVEGIEYSGLDISRAFIDVCRRKYPHIPYYCADVLKGVDAIPDFDYIVMNGIFTVKREMSFEAMWDYFGRLTSVVFEKARTGIAFNVMSKLVDWERDDLFHVPFDAMADFVYRNLSRHFTIRHDYRLYEYTTYVYR
jgi:SAM-dependent methyltransferase